jgi:hypothetical protein
MSGRIIPSKDLLCLWRGVCVLAAAVAGCASPPEKGVVDDNPSVRIRAIKRADERKDFSVVKDLVGQLGDDDPAVRFYAIAGLVRLTGDDHGYRYYDPLNLRQEAVERWKQWLNKSGGAGPETQPAIDKEVSSW